MSVYLVQFPHPGPEHGPGAASDMPWNQGPHKRKFLRSPGRYVDESGALRESQLVFWGEWEPPSRVVKRWLPASGLPCFLHEPVLGTPPVGGAFRQNTDPWVFGNAFRYSNCKQLTPHGNPSALQSLTRGSMILFGSQLAGVFAVDTVFVVAESRPFTPAEASGAETDDAFKFGTIESLATDSRTKAARFTLFRGATADDPVNDMFSFVPCRVAVEADGPRFARPAILLPGYVNPASKQAPAGAGRPLTPQIVYEQWDLVRKQVLAADCALGISFRTPEWSR